MPTLEQILSEMYGQTSPLRTATVSNLQSILGGAPASSLPAYAPNRAAIEGQYNVAAEQARSMLPRGGQLNKAILDLGQGRARAVSDLESAIRGEALTNAARLGFGAVPGLTSGALQSQQLQWQQDVARQNAWNQTFGNVVQSVGLLGTILSGLFGSKPQS